MNIKDIKIFSSKSAGNQPVKLIFLLFFPSSYISFLLLLLRSVIETACILVQEIRYEYFIDFLADEDGQQRYKRMKEHRERERGGRGLVICQLFQQVQIIKPGLTWIRGPRKETDMKQRNLLLFSNSLSDISVLVKVLRAACERAFAH